MTMRAHRLKVWPAQFAALGREDKTCELRKADRDYRAGDYLLLREYVPSDERLTGRYLFRRISHVLTGDAVPRGLVDGFVVLSLATCDRLEIDSLTGHGGIMTQTVEWLEPK